MRRYERYENGHEARGHGDRRRGGGEGGIPDGLLVGILAFLLGLTLLVWTATGLAGLFAKGAWPDAVTIQNTPLAMRHLIAEPHDLPGAWTATPAAQLSGYGLFWGLFIGQLMILIVLTIFVLGTLARWRAVRKARRTKTADAKADADADVRTATAPTASAAMGSRSAGRNEWAQPTSPSAPTDDLPDPVAGQADAEGTPARATTTEPTAPEPTAAPPLTVPAPRTPLFLGDATSRKAPATTAIHDAEAAALILTSDPTLWTETKDARAKLGPVLLYDPTHRCDTPARMHWSPTSGCEEKATAAATATALLAPVRPTAKLDAATADTAETMLRCYLHAAAVDGRTVKHVHRWAQGTQVQEAVRVLRTNSKAAAGTAGELEATLTAHPERRDMAQELTARALSSLFSVHIREACTPNRTDALTLDSFINEGGTLYVVGEPIEDPKAEPGAMPLLTALVSSVVERGRRMAERSSSGRLDPPMTLILDDVAAVAPLPQLPELLSTGADRGLTTLALLRSRTQAQSRWPGAALPI